MSITDKVISNLVCGSKRESLSVSKNLVLRLEPSGKKVWLARFTEDGKQKAEKIGEFMEDKSNPKHVSLKEARSRVKKRVEQASEANGTGGVTLSEIADKWLAYYSKSHSANTIKGLKNRYNLYIKNSHLAELNIEFIKRRDIVYLIESLEDKPQTAKKVLTILNLIFEWALIRGFREENSPVPSSKGLINFFEVKNRAAVTDNFDRFKEIVSMLYEDHQKGEYAGSSLLLFLALCFTRPGEARNLKWEHINFEKKIIELPPEITKTKKSLLIPMAQQVINLFEDMKKRETFGIKKDGYIFHSSKSTKKFCDAIPTVTLNRLGIDRQEQSAHGFRSCASTYLREYLDIDSEIVEKQLNHVVGTSVARVYDKSEHLQKRTEMMQKWADLILPSTKINVN